MSDENTPHPSSLTDDQLKAIREANPEAFDDDAPAGDIEPEAAPEAVADGDDPAVAPEPVAEPEAEPVAEVSTEPGKAPMIPKPRFDEVLAKNAELEARLKAVEARQSAVVDVPASRDFKAEREALRTKWDNGDLDTDDYNDQRDSLVLEEAEHRAAIKFHAMQQQAAINTAAQNWNTKVSAWQQQNADFLANPIRRKAVDELMQALDADPNNRLDDDALLAEVTKQAHEAFNWSAQPAAATLPNVPAANPRDVANARLAGQASAAPPLITGGAGTGSRVQSLDMEKLKPGEFSKLSKADQEALLGEGAL